MKVYHGTDMKFRLPKLPKCNSYTDFGRGFYLTYELERAKEWGANRNPVKYRVNVYELPDYIFREGEPELKVLQFSTATAEWAKFVYRNRNEEDFTHDFDIVVGPVADNDLQVQFAKMMREGLSFDDISQNIKYEKFKKPQICFCTERSLNILKYIEAYAYSNRTSHKYCRR